MIVPLQATKHITEQPICSPRSVNATDNSQLTKKNTSSSVISLSPYYDIANLSNSFPVHVQISPTQHIQPLFDWFAVPSTCRSATHTHATIQDEPNFWLANLVILLLPGYSNNILQSKSPWCSHRCTTGNLTTTTGATACHRSTPRRYHHRPWVPWSFSFLPSLPLCLLNGLKRGC